MQDEHWKLNHERFARELETSLSIQLRLEVQVRLQEDRELPGPQFLEQLEKPTCLYRLRSESWVDPVYLDMNPSVLHPMLDRLLGGGTVAEPLPKRPLTEMEIQLARRILSWLVGSLQPAWGLPGSGHLVFEKVSDAGPNGAEVEVSPAVRMTRFHVALAGAEGSLSFAWPKSVLELIRSEQAKASGMSCGDWAAGEQGDPASGSTGVAGSTRSRVEVRVGLKETTIRRHELQDLSVGDIITTDHGVDEPLEVRVAGVTRFHASPGILRDRTAFRILRAVSPEDGSP